jgi:hypothetical protein
MGDIKLRHIFVTTIKGPRTLIINSQRYKNKIHCELCDKFDNTISKKSTKNKEGLILLSGPNSVATIHSEPPTTEERIVLLITPCTLNEIESYVKKYNQEKESLNYL